MSILPTVCEPRLDLEVPDVTDAVGTAALLADRTRAAVLAMLRDGPRCVCELAAALGERENNVSNHLARLRDAGLVRASRHSANARFLYYERDEDAVGRARMAVSEVLDLGSGRISSSRCRRNMSCRRRAARAGERAG